MLYFLCFFKVFTSPNALIALIISVAFHGDIDIKMGRSIFRSIYRFTFYIQWFFI